jgi:hypothetical protein
MVMHSPSLLLKYSSQGFRFLQRRIRLWRKKRLRLSIVYRVKTKDETDLKTRTSCIRNRYVAETQTDGRLVPQSAGRINRLKQQSPPYSKISES